jgi:hypothetical protein
MITTRRIQKLISDDNERTTVLIDAFITVTAPALGILLGGPVGIKVCVEPQALDWTQPDARRPNCNFVNILRVFLAGKLRL